MNKLEFARIHEMQFHGDIRFHSPKPPPDFSISRCYSQSQYRRIGMRSMNFW